MDSLPAPVTARPSLDGDAEVDVAIVGAGFTGLWTAYYLAAADPSLRIAVIEREVAGFGASGRNGGWCSGLFAVSPARLARTYGLDSMSAMQQAMSETVDEVGRVAISEGIDCHFRKGGSVSLVRSPAQEVRARADLEEARQLRIGEDDLTWLGPAEATGLIGATGTLGGLFTPHCAAIQPARLVRGLAEAVERRGVRIYEQSPVLEIASAGTGGIAGPSPAGSPGPSHRLVTPSGTLRASVVIRATEGYTAQLPGAHRDVLPIYSLMVATEPLDEATLDSIGGASGVTFSDGRHLIIYGQRTADGRLAFGGRGAPYHFGSHIAERFDRHPAVHEALRRTLGELFPALAGVTISHRWGGPLGVHRDWHPSVRFDRRSGLGSAGGYVGDGVATTNLAGRTLADLVAGRESPLTKLCWVSHRSPEWEPEPLRWLGVNSGLVVMGRADRVEARTGRPSRLGATFERLTGH